MRPLNVEMLRIRFKRRNSKDTISYIGYIKFKGTPYINTNRISVNATNTLNCNKIKPNTNTKVTHLNLHKLTPLEL